VKKRISALLVVVLLMPVLLGADGGGCDTEQSRSMNEASLRAQGRHAYVPKNDVEFNNYDRRQKLSDDPTAIIWCTSAFPIPSSPIFTVPIVGKLSSGGKRPYPDQINVDTPGPDGMYGSSGDYRYGFTPGGVYADWYGISTFCTSEPTIWQRQSTTIVMENDPVLTAAHNKAREALKRGDEQEAYKILAQAINSKKEDR